MRALSLEMWYGWIAALLIAAGLLMASECSPTPAHADTGLYLDLAGGVSNYFITATDGDFYQRGLPHRVDLSSVAYRALLGYRINERWSIQGGYVNLGHLKQGARFVDDADYDPKAHRCLAKCEGIPFKMTDAYKGWEASVTRTFPFEDWSLFLRGGGARIQHTFSIIRMDVASFHENRGVFYAALMGAGACYKIVCAETAYYHGLGGSNGFMGQDQGWPLSKELLVSLVSVKVPL